MIIVTGNILAKPGHAEELLAASLEHVRRSRTEPGCIAHAVHRDAENPLRLVFVEEWADRESLLAHFAVPASRAFVKAAAALAASAPAPRYLAARVHSLSDLVALIAAEQRGEWSAAHQEALKCVIGGLRALEWPNVLPHLPGHVARLFDCELAVRVYDHCVGLNAEFVWVDVAAFNERLVEAEAAIEQRAANTALEAALALYRGPCLADSNQTWAMAAGQHLRARLAAALLRAMRSRGNSASQVREWAFRASSADPRLGRSLDFDEPG